VIHLSKMMLEELQHRNYAPNTLKAYARSVHEFAESFDRSPDKWARGTRGSIRSTCSGGGLQQREATDPTQC
jgi:hypothetical protein